jgi:predicted ThiF/HesA family dinucleotide-utilizing enzyme
MKVVIVGVGALGSHAVLLSRNLPVELTIVDFDRVEQKNVLAQLHPKTALGRNKAESLRQTMLGLFGTKIAAIPHKLVDDNVEALLGRADLVVDCVDNGETRRRIQRYVREKAKPCVHGALSADGQFGRVVWDEVLAIDDEDSAGQATCEDGGQLPFVGLAASVLAGVLQAFVERGERRSLHLSAAGITVVDRR